MITVGHALKLLEQADPNAVLVMPGYTANTYVPVTALGVTNQAFDAQTGRVGFKVLTPRLERAGYTTEDAIKGTSAVLIY